MSESAVCDDDDYRYNVAKITGHVSSLNLCLLFIEYFRFNECSKNWNVDIPS